MTRNDVAGTDVAGSVAKGAAADTAPRGAGRDHHGNRHGRSAKARESVLEAVDGLLAEKGFAGVTVEGIAARAGVAKQTIYRWWNTKTDILMEAFLQDVAEEPAPPDHGDVARDLRDHLGWLAAFLGRSDSGAVLKALMAQAHLDPVFAADLQGRYLDEQRRRDRLPLDRAVDRGDLPAGLDVAAETDQLVGPVYYRFLVTGEPIGRDFTDRLVDAFLHRAGRADSTG
ncbi:TetR/AcrR family transcriptional regulator [Streptomyces sp. RKAG293]|uniref:TetR/AcrR family transcriptional regulator n=1 Tax=Streptomyces sp. RKAG293 TaxID=2893403 RepID=UPI0020334D28|nr:TetR/AcrR family transcriptional regulator [Streptomyces sp. RKAG293]MCM2417758.1 TetR/AcrR family transcriptional regulator [Streptomyces sp. RKAG293]